MLTVGVNPNERLVAPTERVMERNLGTDTQPVVRVQANVQATFIWPVDRRIRTVVHDERAIASTELGNLGCDVRNGAAIRIRRNKD